MDDAIEFGVTLKTMTMFRLIADTSFSWEYFRDADRFTYVSPSCTRLTGYTPEQFLSNPRLLEEIAHPSHQKSFQDHLSQAHGEGDPARLRFRLICRDGRECWVEHVCRSVRDANGSFLGLRGSVRDITQYKKDEEQRSAYENRYRVMAELQAEVVCRWLPDTTLTYVNDGYCRLNGMQREELLGKKWISLVPPATRSDVEAYHRALLAEPKLSIYEYGITNSDGALLWYQWVDAPIYDAEQRLVEFQSLGRDYTRERQATLEMQDSEERYRLLAEASHDFIFVIDRNDCFAYVNSAAEAVTGKKPEELIGRSRCSLDVPPDMLARQKEANDIVFATGEPMYLEGHYLLGKGGRPAWHNVNLVPLRDSKGAIWALLGVARDVTEPRERAQRLEEANIALKVLLRHREEDRRDIEEQFLTNFRKLIMPSLEKLRNTELTPRQSAYVDVVEMNVRKIFTASRADGGLSCVNFTPIEMRIVEFIKEEKTTKEIGQILNLSPRTVEYYRDKIRKKLGLKSKNVNLRSYLYSLP